MAPDDWRTGPLRDFADINPRYHLDRGEEAPYIELASVAENFQGVRDIATREFTGSGSRFTSGDVLFARITPSAENGKVALVSSLGEGVVGWGSTEWIVLSPHDGVLPEYLFHLVCSHPVHAVATSMMEGTSGRQRVPHDVMESIQVSVPSVSEQEAIVDVLSMVGDVIGDTRRVRATAQSVMCGLLQDLMTGGIGHSEFQETEVGTIPTEWRVCPLDSLGNGTRPMVKAGPFGSKLKKSHYTDSGYKIYGQEQVLEGSHQFGDYFIDCDRFLELESCAVQPGDVLVTLVGTPGETLVLPEDCQEGVINPRLVRISPDPELVDPQFLAYWLESPPTQRALSRLAQGGTMDILNSTMISSLSIGLPPLSEQQKIVSYLSRLEEIVKRQESAIRTLRNLQRALMQDLLTGRVRAPAP